MKLFRLLTASVLTLFGPSAMASTVLVPTGDTVTFGPTFLPSGFELFMFDDEDTDFIGDSLLVPVLDPLDTTDISIGPSIFPDFTAENVLGHSLTLTDSPNFIVAICEGDDFCYGDLPPFEPLPGGGALFFGEGGVQVAGVAPIPVPAAVWLFGTGLIGLVAVARRRRTR